MKNIPLFSTEYGTASLILREIPYKRTAYVASVSALPGRLPELAQACGEFCRAAGAERVYLSLPEGGDCPWPLHTEILTMTCQRERLLPEDAAVFPVLPEHAHEYRERYNRAMAEVDNAATMVRADEETLISEGGGYFVHRDGQLLGLGQIVDGELRTVVSQRKGGGEAVVRALASLAREDTIRLQVASTNLRAIRLYTRLGFVTTGVKSRWYQIP